MLLFYIVKLIPKIVISFARLVGLVSAVQAAATNKKTATFENILTYVDEILNETAIEMVS